jgi:hypothetical protein
MSQDDVFRQLPCNFRVNLFQVWFFNIIDTTALKAKKMVMRIRIAVISALTAGTGQFLNDLLFLQHCQVSVHRAQTDIGHFGFYPLIKPLGAGMRFGTPQFIEYQLALLGIPCLSHKSTSKQQ